MFYSELVYGLVVLSAGSINSSPEVLLSVFGDALYISFKLNFLINLLPTFVVPSELLVPDSYGA